MRPVREFLLLMRYLLSNSSNFLKQRSRERKRDSRSLNKVAGETAVMMNAFISSRVPISIFSFRIWNAPPLGKLELDNEGKFILGVRVTGVSMNMF